MNLKDLEPLLKSSKPDSEKLMILAQGFKEELGVQNLRKSQAECTVSNAPIPIYYTGPDQVVLQANQITEVITEINGDDIGSL
ncbi:MAG: hypothetical protein V1862_02395 [Methanobacteriota archaeon]